MKAKNNLESMAVDFVAGLVPWLAPGPTAWLVGAATVESLGWPVPVAILAALTVEGLGFVAVNTALTLYAYNQERRKGEPAAWGPFWLAAGLVLVYALVAVALTVALDVLPELAQFAPAIFPILSLCGVSLLALRSDHRRRLGAIKEEREERKAERAAARAAKHAQPTPQPLAAPTGDSLARANASRQAKRADLLESLLAAYQANPNLGATEAAQALGVHRNSIYNYTDELTQAGRLKKNGHGWEVRA